MGMFMSRSPLLFTALLGALVLTGCEDNDVVSYNNTGPEVEGEARKLALDQLNQDAELAKSLRQELAAKDPSVTDVYFKLDEQGERTVVVVRETADGQIETWEAPASALAQAEAQAEKEAGSQASAGSSILPIMGGLLAGYMLANAFSNQAGRMAQTSREAHTRERAMQNSAYNSSVSNKARSQAQQRSTLNRTRGGSFSSSGTRSSGYSSGS